MSQFSTPIKDQGSIGACVTYSDSSAIELQMGRAHMPVSVDPVPWYGATLAYENRVGQDGVVPVDALKVGANGVSLTWQDIPIDLDNWLGTIKQIKYAIAEGLPVEIAFTAREWLRHISGPFEGQQTINKVPNYMDVIGGHQSIAVGYSDTLNGGGFIMQGSWGPDYANHGFYFLSYTDVFDFKSATVIDGYGSVNFRYTPERNAVSELYISLFGRAPDLTGLGYWAHEVATRSLQAVAQSMFSVDAARDYYPAGAPASQTIDSFYVNVLGRHADQTGLQYWSAELQATNAGTTIVDIINAVIGYTGQDQAALISQSLFSNKVAVAEYYAVMLQANDISVAQGALHTVTADVTTVGVAEANLFHELQIGMFN
jgi:hypothetical protein